VKPDATLAWSTRIIMLDAETAKNLHHSVIHAYGDSKLKLTQRIAQEISCSRIKTQVFCYFVELGLRDLE
jgi:hypothetical protein